MWVELLLTMFAIISFSLNVWAAVQTSGWLRWLFIVSATLSLTYTFGYFYLFLSGDVTTFSNVLRPVGFAAWPVVWWAPPIIVVRYLKQQAKNIVRTTQRITTRPGPVTPPELEA